MSDGSATRVSVAKRGGSSTQATTADHESLLTYEQTAVQYAPPSLIPNLTVIRQRVVPSTIWGPDGCDLRVS